MEAAAADEEQEGLSAQSPAQAPPSSASSLPKDQSQVELELRLLQALEFYPPSKLKGQKPWMRASIYTSMAPASMTGKKLKPAAAPGEFGSAASPSHVAVPD